MSHKAMEELRRDAEAIFRASLEAVDPYEAVRRFLRVDGERLVVKGDANEEFAVAPGPGGRVIVVGGGKATAPMARAVEELLGDRIAAGLINVKYGFAEPLDRIETVEAAHPMPDRNGVAGTRRILNLLEGAGENDVVISLISGGGSALLPQPAPGLALEDKQAVTKALLECGASIDEINAVRKHISASKGGQMARAAYPATVVNFMLSDVVGDKMDVIASGPFAPDSATFAAAAAILNQYALTDLPPALLRRLEDGVAGKIADTPKEGDRVFERVHNVLVGSNMLALENAAAAAREQGYTVLILSSMVEGETREIALMHTAIAREILQSGLPVPAPACILTGGETTVTIRGTGKGGRNQEFCLAAAIDLAGMPARVAVLSGGTDGNDGPTDAAGGIVDPATLARAAAAGADAHASLAENDAYHLLQATGDLLVTGPTRTNVMDVRIVLVG